MTDHASRKLQTRETAGVVTEKQHLMEFTLKYRTFDRTNNLNDKLLKGTLTSEDMKEINDLDDLITKGMLVSESKINTRQNQYTLSPTLKKVILEVSLWKLIISELKNDVSKERQIQRIINQLEAPPLLERQLIQIAIIHLRLANKYFKQIQLDAKNHREKFLQHKADEEEIKGNTKHARYIRTLIFIEKQVKMHYTIRIFKTKNGQSNITYIDIQKDTSMDWNEIPKTLPQEE